MKVKEGNCGRNAVARGEGEAVAKGQAAEVKEEREDDKKLNRIRGRIYRGARTHTCTHTVRLNLC